MTQLYDHYLKNPEICTDSRKISHHCLFFALKGPHFNANEYALEALQKGASYAIIDDDKYAIDERFIVVKDTLKTLQELARYHRKKLNCTVLGITGSNGKTTSKELCLQVLKQKYKTRATAGNLNNHIGVPLSLLAIDADTEFAIIEMGANHIGEIDFLCDIAQPDYGVITNVGKAHLEGFGSIDGVLQAKTELYRYLATKNASVFVKDNNPTLIDKIPNNCPVISYGELHKSCFVIKFNGAKPYVNIEFEDTQMKTQLIGDYNFDNIALSIAVGKQFDIPTTDIKEAIENYIASNNRSQIIETKSNTILLDAYNANPMSLEKAIQNIKNISHETKVMILGDMFELGEEAEKEHQKIINQCLKSGVSNVFLVGNIFNRLNKTSYESYATTTALINRLKKQPIKNTFILIKGSRGIQLETLVDSL